jgi:hypothetical protein
MSFGKRINLCNPAKKLRPRFIRIHVDRINVKAIYGAIRVSGFNRGFEKKIKNITLCARVDEIKTTNITT